MQKLAPHEKLCKFSISQKFIQDGHSCIPEFTETIHDLNTSLWNMKFMPS